MTLAAILLLLLLVVVVVEFVFDELSKDETEKLDFGIVTADILRVCVCMCICCSVALFCALLPPNNYSGGVGELLTRMFTLSLSLFSHFYSSIFFSFRSRSVSFSFSLFLFVAFF